MVSRYATEKDRVSFSTPFNSYKYLSLPFGFSFAPEKFQQLTYKYFGGIKNVNVYFYDLKVSGFTEAEHDLALKDVIEKARELNIKSNFAI